MSSNAQELAGAGDSEVTMRTGGSESICVVAIALAAFCGGCADSGRTATAQDSDRNTASAAEVEVTTPSRRDVSRQVELPASIQAFQESTLYSRVSGYLSSIDVDIGDRVSDRQPLAKIDVPDLVDEYRELEARLAVNQAKLRGAEAELESARAESSLQEVTFRRIESVREQEPDVMPQQTVDEARAKHESARAAVKVAESRIDQIDKDQKHLEASMNRLRTLIDFADVRAPFGGVVTERFVDPGTLLQTGTSSRIVQRIVTVADFDRVRVFLDVPESEVPFVQVGDAVTLTVDAMPGKEFEGEVTRFARVLDPATRTMKTEIVMPNPDWMLRPGMYGRATLSLDERSGAVSIPAEALRVDGAGTFVYSVVDGRVKRVNVEAAIADGAVVEITSGLSGNELIVVAAKGPITDGSPVNTAGGGTE